MKNILVILVTVGVGCAYWYQLPEAPATPPPPAAPVAATPRPVFTAAHSVLDEPATPIGGKPHQSSVLLGDDNVKRTH